jgi:epoxyqueuosine reductase
MLFPAAQLKAQARTLGFHLAGITRAEPSPMLDAYLRWIDQGMHGEMGYMARPDRQARRRDLNVILPGARSLVIVGLDYRTGAVPQNVLEDPARGRIAAYAWNLDYHDVIGVRLEQLAAWLLDASGGALRQRVYVDTGAILERSHAQQASMGFIGKNTMLIHPRRGSTFFLGEILTTLDFDAYDTPHRLTLCGSCTRCLQACPTGAFPQPYVLDARRCISYLTIELKGWIPRALRPLLGNWVFGCDLCQDVCPFQRFAPLTPDSVFRPPDTDRAAPPLVDLLALDETGFARRFAGSPVQRIGRARLTRNACIAAANGRLEAALPLLAHLLVADASPLVRGHAAWALDQIAGADTRLLLRQQYAQETDPQVRAEIAALLAQP